MKLFRWPGRSGAAAVAVPWEEPTETYAAAVRAHEAALRGVALRLCRSQSDAHDLVQDTLERGLRGYDRLPAGSNVRAWLLSILRNRFIDQCRRHAREQREEADVAREQLAAAEGPDADPPYYAISIESLRAAVDKLADEFRVVYRLHALEGRSYIEIADRLQIPKATVGTRLIRARRKLRDLLQAQLAEAG